MFERRGNDSGRSGPDVPALDDESDEGEDEGVRVEGCGAFCILDEAS